MSRPRLVIAASYVLALAIGSVGMMSGCGAESDSGTQVQQSAEQKVQQADMEKKIRDAYSNKGPEAVKTPKK